VRAAPDGPGGPRRELIQLVTRLVVAQTIAAAAVGLPFSRRHLPSILITLAHPAVARAFSVRLSRRPAGQQAEPGLGGTAGESLGGRIAQ